MFILCSQGLAIFIEKNPVDKMLTNLRERELLTKTGEQEEGGNDLAFFLSPT